MGRSPRAKPVYSSLTLTNGDAAVVQVSAVREDPSGDSKAQSAEARREFAQAVAAAEAQGYAGAARADCEGDLESAGARLIYGKKRPSALFGQQLRFRRQKARLLPAAPGGPAVF